MKLPPLQSSQSNINTGFNLIGKIYLNPREWKGKFAQQQNSHQYPRDTKPKSKFSQALINNIARLKLDTQTCGLCQVEKKKMEMENMCKCHHTFCYSCLNSYAITKIQELVPVKCPQQDCKQTIKLTSNIFRYLPDSVKLRYLQNKHTFLIDKQKEASLCQRCLEPRHSGQCKIALAPNLIQQSFKYRECPTCRVQIMMTSGKKKVTCQRCKKSLCYLCGMQWFDGHICPDKQRVRQLQREFGYGNNCCCCDCCQYGCEDTCSGCGDCCCDICGDCISEKCCCYILFSCDRPSPGCFIWNIISIPIRLLFTFVILFGMFLIMFPLLLIFSLWLCACLLGGFFYVPCQIISEARCPLSLLLVLLYPLVGIFGFFRTIAQTYKTPVSMIADVLGGFCKLLSGMWVELSPGSCDC